MPQSSPSIGKLRQRLLIQSQTAAKDSYGADIPTWTTQGVRWGSIQPISGAEPWIASQIHPDTTHLVTLRWYAGLIPSWRIVYQNRIFNILSVLTADEIHSVQNVMYVSCIEEVGNRANVSGSPIGPGFFLILTYP